MNPAENPQFPCRKLNHNEELVWSCRRDLEDIAECPCEVFVDLRDVIHNFDSLPDTQEKELLNKVVFKAITAITTLYNPDGSLKAPGLSGMCCREWRRDFLSNKKMTWGNIENPADIPAFNIFQKDILDEADIWDEDIRKLKQFLVDNGLVGKCEVKTE